MAWSPSATGTFAASTYSVYNYGSGTVNITGGTISAANGVAVVIEDDGTVNISGGTVSAGGGRAVVDNPDGKITVSGTAQITSANPSNNNYNGTIYVRTQTTANPQLEITGGTITNTGSGYALGIDYSSGTVTISGGAISANSGNAVRHISTAPITVSGTPAITSANSSATGGTIRLDKTDGGSPVLILPNNWATLITNTATGGNAIYPTTAVSDATVVTVGP